MMMYKVGKTSHNDLIFRFIILILVASIVSILGCTLTGFKGKQNMSYLTDKRFPSKPESAPIEIIPGDPSKPFILIGEVSACADVPLFGQGNAQNAIDKIKAMARKMGGDAIIRYTGYRAPAGTVGAGGFTAQGMVVRWK